MCPPTAEHSCSTDLSYKLPWLFLGRNKTIFFLMFLCFNIKFCRKTTNKSIGFERREDTDTALLKENLFAVVADPSERRKRQQSPMPQKCWTGLAPGLTLGANAGLQALSTQHASCSQH